MATKANETVETVETVETISLTFDYLNEEEFYANCKAADIKPTHLKEAIGNTYLPEKGKFVAYKIEGGEYPTVRLVTDSGDIISCGTLQLNGFDRPLTVEETEKLQSKNGKFYRKPKAVSGKPLLKSEYVNPSLTGNYFNVVKKLLGKNFVAVEATKHVSDFVSGNMDAIEFKPKKSYAITIVPETTL